MTTVREPRHAHKEIRDLADRLKTAGFAWAGVDTAGHSIYTHPNGQRVVLPETPRTFTGARAIVDKAIADATGQPLTGKRDPHAARDRQVKTRQAQKDAHRAYLARRDDHVGQQEAARAVKQRDLQEHDRLRELRGLQALMGARGSCL